MAGEQLIPDRILAAEYSWDAPDLDKVDQPADARYAKRRYDPMTIRELRCQGAGCKEGDGRQRQIQDQELWIGVQVDWAEAHAGRMRETGYP